MDDWIENAKEHFLPMGQRCFVVPWPYSKGMFRVDGCYHAMPEHLFIDFIHYFSTYHAKSGDALGWKQTICAHAFAYHQHAPSSQLPNDPELRRALRRAMDIASPHTKNWPRLADDLAHSLHTLHSTALRLRERSSALYAIACALHFALERMGESTYIFKYSVDIMDLNE